MSRRAPTAEVARSQLVLMLTNARPERLASFTAAELARQYAVPAGEIEQHLASARQSRLSI